ncbi:MAG: hypothetical protein ACYCYK_06990 [Candidatus Dormibacteria bacterium]
MARPRAPYDSLPPVAGIATGALALIVAGGIYLASHMPGPASLLPASLLLVAVDVGLLLRIERFAWQCFFQVGRWGLLAYAISAGMLEYVFILDRVPSPEIWLLTMMLAVYAVDIPLIIAFTVARYQAPDL